MIRYGNLYLFYKYNLGLLRAYKYSQYMNISGHYTILTNFSKFCFWKHGEYESQKTFTAVEFKAKKFNGLEIKFMNDILIDEIREDNEVVNVKQHKYNHLEFRNKTIQQRWAMCYKYEFTLKYMSPQIHIGDKITDVISGYSFLVQHKHNLPKLNGEERYEIKERFKLDKNAISNIIKNSRVTQAGQK